VKAPAARSTTFAVSDVPPGTKPLPTQGVKRAVEKLAGGPVEACSDYASQVVAQPGYHALVAAADFAYARHHPLVLSPDVIWLTIAQGFAQHVANHAEALRPRLVPHQGEATIRVRRDDFVLGSPENPWDEVFPVFSTAIRQAVGPRTHRLLLADFSTTSPAERAASEVVLMGAMRSYFRFQCDTLCGIPAVTLEGTAEDWADVLRRVRALAEYDLEWWTGAVAPILEQFHAAARGAVDTAFWQRLHKLVDDSGAPYLSGWLPRLFPYLKEGGRGRPVTVTRRNPDLHRERRGGGITHKRLPSSLSRVPFVWHHQGTDHEYEFVAGVVGVEQDPATLAVRPRVGWAVRPVGWRASRSDQMRPTGGG
jgi:hypothetical protein